MKTSTPLTSGKLLPFSVEKNNFCSQFRAFRFRPLFSLFAVLGIAFSIVPSSALVLQWDKSPEPDVSGYKVYYGLPSTTPSVVDRGTNISCTFSSLVSGQTYSFYVTAYNSAGLESNPSSPIFYTVPQPSTAAPIISDIADRSTPQDTATPSIAFLVDDLDTPPANLTLSAASSNTILVPPSNIVFGGSGTNRTIKITPAAAQTGTATITVKVSDGTSTASDSFILTVMPSSSGSTSATFANSAVITIPDIGSATPYPSAINVSGMAGSISNVTITLRNLTHTWTGDLDILLVGPTGQAVVLASDAGSGGATNATLTFSDTASVVLPNSPIMSGTFKPANYADGSAAGDTYPSPAPAGPYASALSAFNNTSPNGSWSLYVRDDGPGDLGSFAGGWSLTITTTNSSTPLPAAPTISSIPAQSIVANTSTAPIPFTINDADTPASSLTLSGTSSNPTLVPNANITFARSDTNRTVAVTSATGQTGSAVITVKVSDGQNLASTTFNLTVNGIIGPRTFNNASAISIPDSGPATPYPSAINVSGFAGTISNVTVTLRNLSHNRTRDLDILLVAPTGQKVLLLSDAGGGVAKNVTFTLSDAASSALPKSKISSATFRPANYADASPGGDNFASPAPAGPYASALSAFNNLSPNGTWSLYVMDDNSGYQGSFAGGWTLTIATKSDGTMSTTTFASDTPNETSVPAAPSQLRLTIDNEGDNILLQANGIPGQQYLLESSDDLASWQQTPIATDNQGAIRFNAEKKDKQFYRLSEAP